MKNPMDDEQYDGNDEQIEDLKSALASALALIKDLEEHLDYTGWGDSYERECAKPLMRSLAEFNKETEDWK